MKLTKEVNGKKITFIPLSSATLKLETTGVVTDISYSEDISREIISITINEDYRITKYGAITIPSEDRNIVYEINYIIRTGDKEFLLLSHLRNRTSVYLLPALGVLELTPKTKELNLSTQKEISRYCYNTYLINAYINSENMGILDLVYRFSNHSTYKLFEDCLMKHSGFIKIVDSYKKDDYVSFKLEIPERFKSEVIPFLRGLYSELSKELKTKIIKFHKANKNSDLFKILFKSPKLREELEEKLGTTLDINQELGSIPNRQDEFIDI